LTVRTEERRRLWSDARARGEQHRECRGACVHVGTKKS